jgi:glyoxylase-like metal-dependent hydrolase (beta-lactamase superfamily II)
MRTSAIAAGLLATVLAGSAANAQDHNQGVDFPSVVLETTKLSNTVYILRGTGPVKRGTFTEGAGVGTIGFSAGPDGVFMVDSMFHQLNGKIVAAVKAVTSEPIRLLVDTHVHSDHSDGNESFAKMGAVVLAREEVRDRLARSTNGVEPPRLSLPIATYSGPMTFHMNGEAIELIHAPRAHTDGDTIVVFRGSDVIMTGDIYRSIQFPNIATNLGGSLNGTLDALGLIIGLSGPSTKIVPGHGPSPVDRNAVVAHRDMILDVRDRVAKLIAQGKTEKEVVAGKPAADYAKKIPQTETSEDRFISVVYNELKAGK